jgi:type VI secretion system protein ImpF
MGACPSFAGELCMPKSDYEHIVPSILDRLMDDEPEVSRESLPNRFQNLSQLKKAVARDLEALLNTRQEILEEVPPEFIEVSRSLVTYGLPDFSSFSVLSMNDRRALEQAIATFEPRFERVRVNLELPREQDRTLRFRIEALLRVEPAPEPVTFDAVLRLNTQEYVVQGQN